MKTAIAAALLSVLASSAGAELVHQSIGADPLTRRIVALNSGRLDGGIKTVALVRGAGAVELSPAAEAPKPLTPDPALAPAKKAAAAAKARRAKEQLTQVSQKRAGF